MSQEKRQLLEQLFEQSADLPPQQRTEFVEKHLAQDPALRAELEAMLFQDAQETAEFLKHTRVAAAAARAIPDAVGDPVRIGRYRIVRPIGEGGMGTVYLAEQEEPVRRDVALKVVKLGMDTRAVVARFEAERQALAMMSHPHIAQVFDGGATDRGRPYFVMEYIEGVPITEYCDDHHFDTSARILLFLQVCDALRHAHQRGIIHRDLKPSNLLVTSDGGKPAVKVIDFGIARAAEATMARESAATAQGTIVGTLEYMSPEQLDGAGTGIDTRTDIFSLGVVLYELLAGVLPLDTTTLRLRPFWEAQKIIRESQPARPSSRVGRLGDTAILVASQRGTDPRTLARLLRGDLDWITMRAMEKDRERRYASASDLAADLERFLRHEPVAAGPPSASYRFRKFVRRHRIGVAVAGLALSAVLVAVAGTTWGMVAAQRSRELLRRQLYTSETAQAFDCFEKGLFARADGLLRDAPADLRGFEWNWLRRASHRALFTAEFDSPAQYACAAERAPIAATTHEDGTLRFRDTGTGRETARIATGAKSLFSAALSPSGKLCVTGSRDGLIQIWNVETRERLREIRRTVRITALAIADSPPRVAASQQDTTCTVWDLYQDVPTATFSFTRLDEFGILMRFDERASDAYVISNWNRAFRVAAAGGAAEIERPDECMPLDVDPAAGRMMWSRVASGSRQRKILFTELATGHTEREIAVGEGPTLARGAIDAAHGTWAAASLDGDTWLGPVRDHAGADEVRRLRGFGGPFIGFAWAPSSGRLLAATAAQLAAFDADAAPESIELAGLEPRRLCVDFSDDGSILASDAYDAWGVALWSCATGKLLRVLRHPHGSLATLAFSPDGTRIAGATAQSTATVWNAATGAVESSTRIPLPGPQRIVWSADGTRLAVTDGGGGVCTLEIASGKVTSVPPASGVAVSLAPSAAGGVEMHYSADGRVEMIDPFSRARLGAWRAGALPKSVHVSADRGTVVVVLQSETVEVFDFGGGEPRLRFREPEAARWETGDLSPDGRRFVATSGSAFRLWDLTSGRSLIAVPMQFSGVGPARFSRDGRRLAVPGFGSRHRTDRWVWVQLYQTGPEAPAGEVALVRRVQRFVTEQLPRGALREDLELIVRNAAELDPAVRDGVLQFLSLRGDLPMQMNEAAWGIVKNPNEAPEAYRRGVQIAARAATLSGNDPNVLNTLGVAQYRSGDYQQALDTLTLSEKLQVERRGEGIPQDALFLAMTHARLGRGDDARTWLATARRRAQAERYAGDGELPYFMKEAAELVR